MTQVWYKYPSGVGRTLWDASTTTWDSKTTLWDLAEFQQIWTRQ